MADWLRKFSKKEENKETETDFVLYDDTESRETEQEAEDSASLDETARLNLSDLPPEKEENAPDGFFQKHRSLFLGTGIAVSGLILIAVIAMILMMVIDPLRGYNQAVVAKGNVIASMETEGTLETNATYAITSLVSGNIVESLPEVGEHVSAGTVLYRLDDTEAQLAVKQAENRLEKSKVAGTSTPASLKIYSTESGTVQSMSITSGSTVSAGQVVATVKRSDDSVVSITSMVSGTVSSVNVRRGGTVSAGSLIAMVTDSQAEQNRKTSTYDQKGYEYDLDVAKAQLANYTIKAPVSGVITQKNAKVGDNVAVTNMENPLMVIVDTDSMKFTFQVDEKSVADIEVDQNAIVSTDSVPNETFSGKVSRVSHEGVRNEEGKLMFDVDVTVENPGELKAGMDIKAKIVLDSATNVLYLPKKALLKADGENALVLVKEDGTTATAATATPAPTATAADTGEVQDGNALAFPEIKVPKGCRLVSVRYGVSDGTNVQIISGLKLNQVVVYDPDWTEEELTAVKPSATPTPAKPDANPAMQTSSPVITGTPVPEGENPEVPVTPAPVSSEEEEQLKQEIMDKIRENQENPSN